MNTDGLKFSKPRPAALERQDRRTALKAADEAENKKVKARSGGQCEVTWLGATGRVLYRCRRRAVEINHLLGGIGVRGRGKSALAIHKIHMCTQCHSDYHAHVLRRVGGEPPMWTDRYERVR